MTTPLITELDELLAETVAHAVERERTEFDRLAGPASASIVLFGARKMGRIALAGLRKAAIEPLAFSDNNDALWGQSIDGLEVLSPVAAAKRFGDSAVFVITAWGQGSTDLMRDREAALRNLGCKRVISFGPLFWKYADIFLPRIPAMDLPHKVIEQSDVVRKAFTVLSDERSRREFVAQLRWRLLFDFDALPDPVAEPIYFPADVAPLGVDEVYVDCGAFDGDTILDFLRRCRSSFRAVVAVEPDPVSLARLHQALEALPTGIQARIRVVPAATASQHGTVRFSQTGELGSAIGAGNLEVPCVTLDEVLAADAPTYIKMDIEGAEPDTLLGARQVIARHAPVLAACAYHIQDHLWRLPCLMNSLNPDYRIYLRQHIQMVEDLVCYAVPPQR